MATRVEGSLRTRPWHASFLSRDFGAHACAPYPNPGSLLLLDEPKFYCIDLAFSTIHHNHTSFCGNRRYVANAWIMASSLLHRAWKSVHRLAWKPLVFPKEGIVSIPASEKIEEETIPGYVATRYYPVRIGQIFQNRYQVVSKLGFGTTSTVWLARDLQ